MKPLKQQKGVSLVEVLATIIILSIVMTIIGRTLSSGLFFSDKAEKDAKIQQQTNYIVAVLKETHENGKPYDITVDTVIHIAQSGSTTSIGTEQFLYEISELDDANNVINTATSTNTIHINPSNNNFHVQIKLTSVENSNITYTVTTILSRM